MQLARPEGALPRGVGRCPHLGRHHHDRTAADRAALRRPVVDRAAVAADRRRQAGRGACSSRAQGARLGHGRRRSALAAERARRLRRGLDLEADHAGSGRHAAGESARSSSKSQSGGTKRGNGDLEITFHFSSNTYDGRFANNPWLQETPDFLTKVTWVNFALVGPETATVLGLEYDTMITVKIGDRSSVELLLLRDARPGEVLDRARARRRAHRGRPRRRARGQDPRRLQHVHGPHGRRLRLRRWRERRSDARALRARRYPGPLGLSPGPEEGHRQRRDPEARAGADPRDDERRRSRSRSPGRGRPIRKTEHVLRSTRTTKARAARRATCRCSRSTRTRVIAGRWRPICRRAPAATRAWSRARPRTTSRSSVAAR